jgi:osmotically-inducible protein OsmY
MRRAAFLIPLLVAGCSLAEFYAKETEGIGPAKLLPLYFQEKQYVQDRTLEAKVKGALAADPALAGTGIEVGVYKGEATLSGRVTPEQARQAARTAKSVLGVESVKGNLQ